MQSKKLSRFVWVEFLSRINMILQTQKRKEGRRERFQCLSLLTLGNREKGKQIQERKTGGKMIQKLTGFYFLFMGRRENGKPVRKRIKRLLFFDLFDKQIAKTMEVPIFVKFSQTFFTNPARFSLPIKTY